MDHLNEFKCTVGYDIYACSVSKLKGSCFETLGYLDDIHACTEYQVILWRYVALTWLRVSDTGVSVGYNKRMCSISKSDRYRCPMGA